MFLLRGALPAGRAFNEASRGCPDALHNASGARGACLAALPSRRCAACSPGFERRALCDESGVYGASMAGVRRGEQIAS